MKKINIIETAYADQKSPKEVNINRTFFWAYINSKDVNKPMIDFNETVWEDEMHEVFENLDRFHINEFSVSSSMSSIISVIARFTEKGWRIKGMMKVPTGRELWPTKEPEMADAIVLERIEKLAPPVDTDKEEMNENLKDWYTSEYPTDELGQELNQDITLNDVLAALQDGKDVYETMGVADSIVRERVFDRLAAAQNWDYDIVYEMWQKG